MALNLSEEQGPPSDKTVSVDLGGGSLPAYEKPKLLGQEEATAAAPVSAPTPMQQAPVQRPIPNPGMVPVQTTVSSSQADPKLLKEYEKATADAQKAAQSQADAAIAQNTAIAQEQRARAAMMANQAAEQEKIQAERQQAAREKLAAVDAAVKERDAFKFNPGRHYERMGVGGSILAVIGQSLGAFGAAITHSPNYAQQMIEKAVENDIHSQQLEYQALGAKVDSRRNDYAYFRQQGLDDDSSKAALRTLRLQQSATKIDEIIAGTNNAKIQADADRIKAGLNQTDIAHRMEFTKRQIQTTMMNPATAGQAGTQLPSSEAEKLGTANAAIQAATDLYKDWEKDASGVGGYIASKLPGTDATTYSDKRAMAKQVIGSYLEGGVLRKEDEAKYDKYLPEAGDSQKRAQRKRDSLMALISQRAQSQQKALIQAGFRAGGIEIKKPVTTFKPAP